MLHTVAAAVAVPPQRRLRSGWRMLFLIWFAFAFGQLLDTAGAQNRITNATIDPSEGRAINNIFGRWGISATNDWNISGNLCSGVAVNATDINDINPGIKCDCSFANNSTCRITALRVFALGVHGPLPDELWNFTYLTSLNLAQNYLTGPLPASIGNLTRMQYLNLGSNALSRELGQLTFLQPFSFGSNNFSGPLPSELGSLSRLKQIYFDSSEVSGPIPETFSNLTSLEKMWASDNDLTGQMPGFIGNWSNLVQLNLAQNYLTGPLPASIGNLTRMQYLNLGSNALSRELGQLTFLQPFSFGSNNFSGPLPSELGSLSRLKQIYFDSSEVSGPIPETFSNLTSLEIMHASDNELTGQIPGFIGNWSNLVQLRLQGNSFQGPIPSSFFNLTSLFDLRISDLSNGSSSLNFLRNMSSLSTLVLRNNNISGSIPSYFGVLEILTLLDLSFNNLTGTIPQSLFSNSSLRNLFLGNNRLIGGLPSQKSPLLRNIDLSYNELSGDFPSWLFEQNLQLNLVSNNFSIQGSNTSALPFGLNCLQRNFPCNRGQPIYSSFAIKCGGPEIRSSDHIVYETEEEALGPATYYVTNTLRWAVSNVGLHDNGKNLQYRSTSSSQFTNTLDSVLFQTARVSAGSLRYYGLGLENGNYTVRLQFAESEIIGTRSWKSLGRRIFDIYMQGNLAEKDFDIRREAGGISLRAVERAFNVQVSENYLEIHLFWAGKGTCCIPIQFLYGPSISAISATPNFIPTVSNNPPSEGKYRIGLIVGIVVPVAVAVATLLSLFAVYVLQRRKRQKNFEDNELQGIDARPYTFSYAELRAATDDFNLANKLGEGGFGTVYKGKLGDGRVVAVKKLSVASHQGKRQFLAEIATISAVQHRNLVKLYGCCIEGAKHLLSYEYLENKSLDQLLFEPGSKSLYLDWEARSNICMGVARGLAYLHEESQPRIVHRDVKASNILLDSDLTPKISDFGLAKLYDDKMTHISTRIAGTVGYLAPEYAMRGHLTEKADVFSFGVVAMEIISGRPNSDSTLEDDRIYLLEWAWNLHENNRVIELVDLTLHQYVADEVRRIIGVALLCTQASPGLRPPMSRVVAMLSGDIEVPTVAMRPSYLTDWKFDDVTTFVTNIDDSTSDVDLMGESR